MIFFEETKKVKFRVIYNLSKEILHVCDKEIFIPRRIYYSHIKNKLEITINKDKIVYNKNKDLINLLFKLANRKELHDLFYVYRLHEKFNRAINLKPFNALDSFYNSIKNTWEKYFIIDLDNYEKIEEILI